MEKTQHKVIDLFCGAGGLSRGFEDAGFNIVLGIDINEQFKDTFNKNHKKSVFQKADLSEDILDIINCKNIDLLIGSPPCQGFSKARGCRKEKNHDHIKRNNLPFDFIRIVGNLKPKISLMENVSGLGTFKVNNRLLVDYLVDEFDKIGYYSIFENLNSANYGVPQERIRVFGLAIKKEFQIMPVLNKWDLNGLHKLAKDFNNVNNAIGDLPKEPSNNGEAEYATNFENCLDYQKLMRSKNKLNKVYNHQLINYPNEDELILIKKLEEGKIFRSSRFGNRYMGVWQLYSEKLKEDERQLLHFLCRKRTNNDYKEEYGEYKEGFVRIEKFPVNKDGKFVWEEEYPINGINNNRAPSEIIASLLKGKWLRVQEYKKDGETFIAYDINTKSGIRPMYMRLSRFQPSRTILTTSFRVRELIHPTENRAITLREGARIQSFPDDFIFYGNNNDIRTMIGNAVPPLMAFELAKYLKILLNYFEDDKNKSYKKIIKEVSLTKSPINKIGNIDLNQKKLIYFTSIK